MVNCNQEMDYKPCYLEIIFLQNKYARDEELCIKNDDVKVGSNNR